MEVVEYKKSNRQGLSMILTVFYVDNYVCDRCTRSLVLTKHIEETETEYEK